MAPFRQGLLGKEFSDLVMLLSVQPSLFQQRLLRRSPEVFPGYQSPECSCGEARLYLWRKEHAIWGGGFAPDCHTLNVSLLSQRSSTENFVLWGGAGRKELKLLQLLVGLKTLEVRWRFCKCHNPFRGVHILNVELQSKTSMLLINGSKTASAASLMKRTVELVFHRDV